jgi:hypothetical protein
MALGTLSYAGASAVRRHLLWRLRWTRALELGYLVTTILNLFGSFVIAMELVYKVFDAVILSSLAFDLWLVIIWHALAPAHLGEICFGVFLL